MTNFRELCDELLDELEFQTDWSTAEELKERASAALAEPEPEEPTDEEISDLWSWTAGQDQGPWPTQQHCFARSVLARWGK